MFLVILYRNALTEVFGWMWLVRVCLSRIAARDPFEQLAVSRKQ
jgi:hypothetical protein